MRRIRIICYAVIIAANVVSFIVLRDDVRQDEQLSDQSGVQSMAGAVSKRLTTDDARNIAADSLGAACSDMTVYRSYLYSVGGSDFFRVECAFGGMDHLFEIDAYTGAILKEEHGK